MATFGTSDFEVLIETVTTSILCIEQALTRLEVAPFDTEALEGTYHHLHTIGRAASMAKWPMLSYLAHGSEGILADIIDGFGRLDTPTLELLSHSLVTMNQLLQRVDSTERHTHSWQPPSSTAEESEVVIETFITQPLPGQGTEAPYTAGPFTSHTSAEHLSPSRADGRGENATGGMRSVSNKNSVYAHQSSASVRLRTQKTERAIIVISALQRQRSSGVLLLRRGEGVNSEEGSIQFVDGQITNARIGRRSGAEARNWLSTWTNCHFAFQSASSTTRRGSR